MDALVRARRPRGRLLVDALIVWITPDRALQPGINRFEVRISDSASSTTMVGRRASTSTAVAAASLPGPPRRRACDRGRGQARPFGTADLAAVLATCR